MSKDLYWLPVARRAIQEVARRSGVSVEQVRREIQAAIDQGVSSPEPEIRSLWRNIPCKGPRPEPEAVVLWAMLRLGDGVQEPFA